MKLHKPTDAHIKRISKDFVMCYGIGEEGHQVWKWGNLFMIEEGGWVCGLHTDNAEEASTWAWKHAVKDGG